MAPTHHPALAYRAPTRPEYVEPPDSDDVEELAEEAAPKNNWWMPTGVLEWFAVSQTLLPALLYLSGNQPFRLALRAGAFAISLVMWSVWWFGTRHRPPERHPAGRWLVFVMITLLAGILNPGTPSLLAGIAQVGLYTAIFCPLFWVSGFKIDRRTLLRVLGILLICNGINSIVGVLQVYDPDTWLPREFAPNFARNSIQLASVLYMGPNGRLIARPPGLFDTPGAVVGAGMVAAILGLVFALEPMAWWKRFVALGFAAAGMAAIYLSHVRMGAVVAVGMMVTYAILLAVQNEKKRVVAFASLAAALIVSAFAVATYLGGTTVEQRIQSLFETDPRDLYYKSRGIQVEHAFTQTMDDYPYGAGLARWGVTAVYFGVPASQRIWAEIQPPAWILDGGLFLLTFYCCALIAAVLWEWKLVRRVRDPADRRWSAAIMAANAGTLAGILTYVPFTSQVGLQFWFLEGLLFGAMWSRVRD